MKSIVLFFCLLSKVCFSNDILPSENFHNVFMNFDSFKQNLDSKSINGTRIGYEYLKNKSFYFGIDYFLSQDKIKFDKMAFNNEIRIGYNFHPHEKISIVPFLGSGLYTFQSDYDKNKSFSCIYHLIGCQINYDFNERLKVGIKAKFSRANQASTLIKFHPGAIIVIDEDKFWWEEVSFPLNWKFTESKKLSLDIQPYIHHFSVRSNTFSPGARIGVRYAFGK